MSELQPTVNIPPRYERKLLGILRPTQAASAVGALGRSLWCLGWVRGPFRLPLALLFIGVALLLAVVQLRGFGIDEWIGHCARWCQEVLMLRFERARQTKAKVQLRTVIQVHAPDLHLLSAGQQVVDRSQFGLALAQLGARSEGPIQLLTCRQHFLNTEVAEQLQLSSSEHQLVTLLIVASGHDEAVTVLLEQLHGKHWAIGSSVETDRQIVATGRTREIHLGSIRTSSGWWSSATVRSFPERPVALNFGLALVVNPPFDCMALTIRVPSRSQFQRRLERRQTGSMADRGVLERRGFRRSARAERQTEGRDSYETSLAAGSVPVEATMFFAIRGATRSALVKRQTSLLGLGSTMEVEIATSFGRQRRVLGALGNPGEGIR